MKHVENSIIEVRVLDDGLVQLRRKDRKPVEQRDFEEALRLADSLPGTNVNDVLRVFPGAKVRQHGGNER